MIFHTVYSFQNVDDSATQIDLNVQRVSIVLARGIACGVGSKVARKVAAVTFVDLDFSAELGSSQTIRGSLGGVEIWDLTPENFVHRCILSIGDCSQDVKNEDEFCSEPNCKAFVCSFSKLPCSEVPKIDFNSHIASARYVHSAEFLSELLLCAGDFRSYAASAAKSLQTAAADVAKEFVSAANEGESVRVDSRIDTDDMQAVSSKRTALSKQLSVFICVETPVIVLPRSFNSPDLLVGNLGRITIRNTQLNETVISHGREEETCPAVVDRIFLDINNVSLYSLSLSQYQVTLLSDGKPTFEFLKRKATGSSTPLRSPHRNNPKLTNLASVREEIEKEESFMEHGEDCNRIEWIEILHETGFQLVVDRISQDRIASGPQDKLYLEGPSFKIEGKILKALKLELSSKTYNQLLETLNSLSARAKQEGLVEDQNAIFTRRSSTASAASPDRYSMHIIAC